MIDSAWSSIWRNSSAGCVRRKESGSSPPGSETTLTEVTLVAGSPEAEIHILSTGYQIDGIVADPNGSPLLNGMLAHSRLTFDGLTVRDDRTHLGLTFYGDDGQVLLREKGTAVFARRRHVKMEHETGFEPATASLEGWHSAN